MGDGSGESKRSGVGRRCGAALMAVPTAAAAVHVASSAPVAAFPQDPNNCEDRTIEWDFDSSWSSYPTARGWATEGLGLLNQPLDFDGTPLVEVVRDTTTHTIFDVTVSLQFEDEISLGESECNAGPSLWINSRYITESKFVRRMVKHEMGHLLGAEHSGNNDSLNGDNPPVMGTCGPRTAFQSTNMLTQDDYAYLNYLWSTRPNRQLTANFGFEQGTSFWGLNDPDGDNSMEWVATGGATGPGYIRAKNAGDGIVYQTINLATGDDDEQYRAVINYKSENGSDSDQGVTVALLRQTLDYLGSANGCAYADGMVNLNSPSPNPYGFPLYNGQGWVVSATNQREHATQTSWTTFTTSWANPPDTDGYRLQVWAAPHYSATWMDFDNVRIEGT